MKRQISLTTLALLAGTLGTASALGPHKAKCPPCPAGKAATGKSTTGAAKKPSPLDVTANWPAASKKAAAAYSQKYGMPDETSSRLVAWNDRGDFSRIVVYRTSLTDTVPSPHQTFIEHQVRYMVPAFKAGDLQNFDKSLVIDAKNGTLSSRSDNAKGNILALNLADEIVTGKRTVADAQDMRAKTERLNMAGKMTLISEHLAFTPDTAGEPHAVRALPPY